MKKELRELLKELTVQGFDYKRRTKNHYAVFKDGRYVTDLGSSPSEYRGGKNALAALKRAGFDKNRKANRH